MTAAPTCFRETAMTKESLLNFVGTGALIVPLVVATGTGSLDAMAMCLMLFLPLFLAVLAINPDDPIGDKIRAEQERADRNDQRPPSS